MKCPLCNGRKKILEPCDGALLGTVLVTCYACNGTGEVTMTNEEWLHTLPMEEMADEIISHIAHEIGLARYYNDDDVKDFVEWLKEAHKE